MKLDEFKKTLKELSFDIKNNKYICNCKNIFIDFDRLKKVRKTPKEPYSPDMLFIDDESKEIWFVEFKSSTLESLRKERFKIKRKILDGLIIFYEIFKSYFEYKKFYFVVYNKPSNFDSEDELVDLLSEEKTIEFDLEELKGKFLEDVFTENCETFKQIFSDKFNIEFDCQ